MQDTIMEDYMFLLPEHLDDIVELSVDVGFRKRLQIRPSRDSKRNFMYPITRLLELP